MIIARTPLRISFFGGGTDLPDFYRVYGGQVLSTTINKYMILMQNEWIFLLPLWDSTIPATVITAA